MLKSKIITMDKLQLFTVKMVGAEIIEATEGIIGTSHS